jgi:hypothetical protein
MIVMALLLTTVWAVWVNQYDQGPGGPAFLAPAAVFIGGPIFLVVFPAIYFLLERAGKEGGVILPRWRLVGYAIFAGLVMLVLVGGQQPLDTTFAIAVSAPTLSLVIFVEAVCWVAGLVYRRSERRLASQGSEK